MRIEISIEGLPPFYAQIEDTAPVTYRRFVEALPIVGSVNRWGDEIYFFVDFQAPLERGARSSMKIGEIAYWPNGPALAVFFGPTPASSNKEPVAASDCNILGRTDAAPDLLRKAAEDARIRIVAKA